MEALMVVVVVIAVVFVLLSCVSENDKPKKSPSYDGKKCSYEEMLVLLNEIHSDSNKTLVSCTVSPHDPESYYVSYTTMLTDDEIKATRRKYISKVASKVW